jgi:hypothetical protein
MGKKMTKAGMQVRRDVRAAADASPGIEHLALRRQFQVQQGIVESALTKTVAEWDAIIAETPDDPPAIKKERKVAASEAVTPAEAAAATAFTVAMPGLEQGIVKFTRKPAKMGQDYIFWVPRVYIKNGIVDPRIEYEVYLKKKA